MLRPRSTRSPDSDLRRMFAKMCVFAANLPFDKCALIITQNQHFCKAEMIVWKGKTVFKKVHFFEHIRVLGRQYRYGSKRSAKGNGSAGHLIHREAVPLPRKDRVESEEWRVELKAPDIWKKPSDIGRLPYFNRYSL